MASRARTSPVCWSPSFAPGERLDLLLPRLDDEARATVGGHLGVVLGRLGHMAMPRAGLFVDPLLTIGPLPDGGTDLPEWVEAHAGDLAWAPEDLAALRGVADAAQDLLDAPTAAGAWCTAT